MCTHAHNSACVHYNTLLIPWKQCNSRRQEKHKPKLSSERCPLHDVERVHDPLLWINRTINIIENESKNDTSPQHHMINHRLMERNREPSLVQPLHYQDYNNSPSAMSPLPVEQTPPSQWTCWSGNQILWSPHHWGSKPVMVVKKKVWY